MGAFNPGIFNPMMMFAGKGMFPGAPGMPGMPGMFPPMWGMPGFPGTGGAPPLADAGRRPPPRRFSRSRSRGRSRSRDQDDRGKNTDYISIPRSIMGRVIGKAGANIKKIRDDSGARIDAEDRSNDQCEFRIAGTPDQVDKARRMLEEAAKQAATGGRGTDDLTDYSGPMETLEFPVAVMGGIIGAKGVKIQEVRSRSGAKVQVERSGDVCRVQIAGENGQIDVAKAMIRRLADEEASVNASAEGPDAVTENMEFPVSVTGRLIGSRGSTIAEVRAQSGAKLSVEKADDRCRVQIAGSEDQVRRARQMIVALAEGGDEAMALTKARGGSEETMDVPLNVVGRVIGKGGETVTKLQKESGARIDVNTSAGDPCPVRLTGTREQVQHARMLILELVDKRPGAGQWPAGEAWPPMGACGGWPPPPPMDWQYGGLPPAGDGGGNWDYSSAGSTGIAKAIDLDEL